MDKLLSKVETQVTREQKSAELLELKREEKRKRQEAKEAADLERRHERETFKQELQDIKKGPEALVEDTLLPDARAQPPPPAEWIAWPSKCADVARSDDVAIAHVPQDVGDLLQVSIRGGGSWRYRPQVQDAVGWCCV